MYLSRELTDNSLPKIGKEFGGKDHTTVIHAHAKIKSLIDEDDNLRLEIESIKKKLNNLWITFTLLSFLSTFFKQAKKLDMTCLKSVFHRFHRLYYYYYPSNTKNK